MISRIKLSHRLNCIYHCKTG